MSVWPRFGRNEESEASSADPGPASRLSLEPTDVETDADRPELVVGFIAPLGTNLRLVVDLLSAALKAAGYGVEEIKLTHLLTNLVADGSFTPSKPLETSPEERRIAGLQRAGDELRRVAGVNAMAMLGLAEIRRRRARSNEPEESRAYFLLQLKHPGEIALLRQLFGDRLVLIGASSPRSIRQDLLAKKLAGSDARFEYQGHEPRALELINIDEYEEDPSGQRVRDAFPMADLFVDPSDEIATNKAITRFVELLLSHPFHTPTVDELGMRLAHTMALRSAAMGRQVGAAIVRPDGTIASLGANDVPKPGGGVYWPHDDPDARDHVLGDDQSNLMQQRLIAELLGVARDNGWLNESLEKNDLLALVQEAMKEKRFSGTRAVGLIEFVRTLHAEMNAILDAARYGADLAGATLYTTTYPCHECTRHIIGVGIGRVVFVEPYPKSLADTLHSDAIISPPMDPTSDRVVYEPFIGVAPWRFDQVFTMGRRKDAASGAATPWIASQGKLKVENKWGPIVARVMETTALDEFWSALEHDMR